MDRTKVESILGDFYKEDVEASLETVEKIKEMIDESDNLDELETKVEMFYATLKQLEEDI